MSPPPSHWRLAGAVLLLGSGLPALADEVVLHTVAPGDTLISLSQNLLQPGTDWRELQRANPTARPRRLQPGSSLRLPLALLREQPLQAEVLHSHGDVGLQRAGGPWQPLAGGEALVVGDVVRTGAQSSATLRFADGSRVLLRPGSRLRVERTVALGRSGVVDTRLGLEAGAADAQVPPAAPAQPARRFQIRTPVANLGVRGTEFRTRTEATLTAVEVLEGRVATGTAAAPAGATAAVTAAGFGNIVTAQGAGAPRALPPAPGLQGLPARVERLPLRLAWQGAAAGGAWRAQVFQADAPGQLVLDGLFDQAAARWSDDLPDGRYQLRVRAVGADGLEGHDSRAAFVLKARPEPPFTTRPRAGARNADETQAFGWTRNTAAARYRLQVADGADFAAPRIDRDDITGDELRLALPVGTHHWRMASVRADGDTGPWSDPQQLTRVALPPPPSAQPPQATPDGVLLLWRAEPGARYQVQVAADAAFAQPLHDEQVDTAQWLLRQPAPGQYFVRVRSIDADGFTGPYGAVQQVDVPRSRPWWLLLPLVLLLL